MIEDTRSSVCFLPQEWLRLQQILEKLGMSSARAKSLSANACSLWQHFHCDGYGRVVGIFLSQQELDGVILGTR